MHVCVRVGEGLDCMNSGSVSVQAAVKFAQMTNVFIGEKLMIFLTRVNGHVKLRK